MDKFIKGMDVSSLPEETALGARFYDEGKEGDALEILKNTVPTLCASVFGMILTVRTASLYSAGTSDFTKLVALASAGKSWATAICWICITVISGQIPANSSLLRSGRMPVRMHWRSMCMITQRMCF